MEPEPDPSLTPVEQFFSFNSDSVGPFLTIAIDTLRERQPRTPFVEDFIQTKGVPVWDIHSAFFSKNQPVVLVPVRDADEPKITGIIYISAHKGRPIFRWVPRDAKYQATGLPTHRRLETFMLMYEKMVFGRVQTPGVNVHYKTITEPREKPGRIALADGWVRIRVIHHCGSIDAWADGSYSDAGCLVDYVWVRLDGHGPAGPPPDGGSDEPGGPDDSSGGCTFGCGGQGPIDPPLCSETNSADYCVSIEEQLNTFLEEYEYALLDIPCEQIPKWIGLAQHTPPQSVLNKLEQEYYGDIDILYLQDAAGTVVNMDYFSVNVNSLPQGMTALELMNKIRMSDINDFINTDYAFFSPYDYAGYSFDETSVWHSSNPLGAVLSIDIALPADDGSVVVSDFNLAGWIFSTVSDPWNFAHPVSGNRMFGYVQNNNGSYTFFTRGVDRITRRIDNFVAENFFDNPFESSDALWASFQKKLRDYINQNGGSATLSPPKKYRPDWENVSDVLTEEASISTLGCN